MTDAVIEGLGQIGRRLVVTERHSGAGGDFDEIDLAGFLKGQPQLPGGQPEQAGEALDGRPFSLAQLRTRQLDQHGQRFFEAGDIAQFGQQFEHGLFLVGEFLVSRKADALVDRFANSPRAGHEERRNRLPARQIGDSHGQPEIPVKNEIERFRHIGCCKAGQGHEQALQTAVEQVTNSRQIALDQRRKSGLDFALHRPAFDARSMLQPLVAPAKHGNQQPFQATGVVVHEGQRLGHDVGIGAAGLDHFQRPPCCRRVMSLGVLGDTRLRPEAAEVRHLAGQAGAQRIERRDAQAAGMAKQLPALRRIVGQDFLRQAERQLLVRLGRPFIARGALQAAENAVAHLGRRLVGEGQRQDLFRMFDNGEQAQVALGQQLGLAGTRWRLDDEGGDLERPQAGDPVFVEAVNICGVLLHKHTDHCNTTPHNRSMPMLSNQTPATAKPIQATCNMESRNFWLAIAFSRERIT